MKYVMTFFWTFILGQVVGYLGSSLTHSTYDFTLSAIISLICAAVIILIGELSQPKEAKQ